VATVALRAIHRGRLQVALLTSLAAVIIVLALMAAGPQAAEGSHGPGEAQAPSTSKPVAALLGTVAATVEQVAGQEVVAAPPTPGSTSTPSPVESVVPATTGQSAAPADLGGLLRDTSAGSTGSASRRSTPDVAATLRSVSQPVRQVAGVTLHRAAESVGGVVARVPVVAESARRTVGEVATVAGGLLEKTPREPIASRTPGLLDGPPAPTSTPGAPGLAMGALSAVPTASPGEMSACISCADAPPAALFLGPNIASARTASRASGLLYATRASPKASSPAQLASGSTRASSSLARTPSTPRSPAPGGVASSAGGAAACAGLALALLWLLATTLPGVKRRLGEGRQVRLIAPFELILQRPG
jgi:hypothetical protein